jgi:hypothetical protein
LYRATAKTRSGRLVEAAWVLDNHGHQTGATTRSIENPSSIGSVVGSAPVLDPARATVRLAGAGQVAVTKLESPASSTPRRTWDSRGVTSRLTSAPARPCVVGVLR